MNQPLFNWKTYPAEYSEPSSGTRMNVSTLSDIRPPKDNELVRMLCFNSGIRQSKELQNWNAWNGCVFVDVDYKNYMSYKPDATDPLVVFKDVYQYLVEHHSEHFYYGELSRSHKGFHFIFCMDNKYPSEEKRDSLNYMANAAVIKAFTACGYEEAIHFKVTKHGVDTCKVLDTCSRSPYQMCYITGIGKINDRCICDWKVNTDGLSEIIEELRTRRPKKTNNILKPYTYKAKLLKCNNVQSVPYIEHLVRRDLFKSLSTIFSGDDLKREWTRCAMLIPEVPRHTTEYYINAPYTLDWNESLSNDEYCDKNLLRMFGYEVQIQQFERKITYDEVIKNINNILNESNKQTN